MSVHIIVVAVCQPGLPLTLYIHIFNDTFILYKYARKIDNFFRQQAEVTHINILLHAREQYYNNIHYTLNNKHAFADRGQKRVTVGSNKYRFIALIIT